MFFLKKQNGAISVFLTIVLIPVLLISCLTVDVSRLYVSKVVISDAGEMTLNAGLARYNEQLFDQYGFLAMENYSDTEQTDFLESYFVNSLNSSGLSDVSGYDDMLGLIEEGFEAINAANTELYHTEIEKQQIMEYMKYRAPVCLTELLLEKLNFIKDSKKIMEAMDKEMEFADSMEECQDEFEKALKILNALSETVTSIRGSELSEALDKAYYDYIHIVAPALMIIESLQMSNIKEIDFKEFPSIDSMEELIDTYAEKADVYFGYASDPINKYTYDYYLETVIYELAIKDAGGIEIFDEKLNEEFPEELFDEDLHDEGEIKKTKEKKEKVRQKYEKIKEKYNSTYSKMSTSQYAYLSILNNMVNDCVKEDYKVLNSYYLKSKTGFAQAEKAISELEYVREKLLQASNSYENWASATSELDDETAGGMKEDVQNYKTFFGGDDYPLEDLSTLEACVKSEKEYFSELSMCLENETFYNSQVAITSVDDQIIDYIWQAHSLVRKCVPYEEIESLQINEFANNYKRGGTPSYSLQTFENDPFYEKLQQYCAKKNGEKQNSEKEENEGNNNLNEGSKGADEAKETDDSLKFNWADYNVQRLPSVKMNLSKFDQKASDTLTALDSGNDVGDKTKRKNIISKMKASIKEAEGFVDGLDRIITDNVENLYVAEYAMQMFSYYTCDKKMDPDTHELKTLKDEEITSISGYKLSGNKAYKSEIEYILWGNSVSNINVQSTVALLFGVRLLFNSIYAFTSPRINETTTIAATAIAGLAPFLIPIIKVALKFGEAVVLTSGDIKKLKAGYGVTILYTDNNTQKGQENSAVTLDYGEYLRIFLIIQMLAGKEDKILARIGDCVQVNTDTDITADFTMIEVKADVGMNTVFLRNASDWFSIDWDHDDKYTYNYKGILGY